MDISKDWSVILAYDWQECATPYGNVINRQWSASIQNSNAATSSWLSASQDWSVFFERACILFLGTSQNAVGNGDADMALISVSVARRIKAKKIKEEKRWDEKEGGFVEEEREKWWKKEAQSIILLSVEF